MKDDLGSSIVFEILLKISQMNLGSFQITHTTNGQKKQIVLMIYQHIFRRLNPIRYLSRLNGTVSTKVINGSKGLLSILTHRSLRSQQVPAGKWRWKIFLLNGNYNGNYIYIADQWELYIADADLITLICVDISMGTRYTYIYIYI